MHLHLGGVELNSFWIGSVLVIVLTGLYTALGGMRAVAYNDAVQVVVLISGSALLTFYGLHKLGGWRELRRLCGSDMFNLWKPLIPAGVEATWAPVMENERRRPASSSRPGISTAIFPGWAWPSARRSSACGTGAPTSTSSSAPWALPTRQIARRGSIFAAFLKLFPVYLFIIPGLICFALAKSGKMPALTAGRSTSPTARRAPSR